MKLNITREASQELRAISKFYANKNEVYSEKIVVEIVQFCVDNLLNFPKLGVLYDDEYSIYKIVMADFNIYYNFDAKSVNILHVFHHKQDLSEKLGG